MEGSMKTIFKAICLFFILMILTGVLYPLIVTGLAQGIFHHRANGSLIHTNGKVIGSRLIAQEFESDRYFWPRPSGPDFQTVPSGASNQGPTSKALRDAIQERRTRLLNAHGLTEDAEIPLDLLFSSGSGLDPQISPKAAFFQIDRIVKARQFTSEKRVRLEELVQRFIETPQFGFFGEPRVNVLVLNIALDQL
jgi:K+-transporting ATPase ATPase C chain